MSEKTELPATHVPQAHPTKDEIIAELKALAQHSHDKCVDHGLTVRRLASIILHLFR